MRTAIISFPGKSCGYKEDGEPAPRRVCKQILLSLGSPQTFTLPHTLLPLRAYTLFSFVLSFLYKMIVLS